MTTPYEDNRWETIPIRIETDPDACAEVVADEIAALIRKNEADGRKTVLGLATGSTPRGVYRALVRRHQEEALSFRNVVTFNLDEYFPITPDDPHSYHRYMWENLFSHLDILPENVHIPRGNIALGEVSSSCLEYEKKIAEAGGLDLQLLGIGRSGHIGFNEPGSPARSRTRLITLDHITRSDAAPEFQGLHRVPTRAITMGIRTILAARRVILLVTGEHKAAIVRTAVEGKVTDEVPATFLQGHDNVTAILDLGAAADLTRLRAPWLLGPLADQGLAWNETEICRAVLWLAEKTGKAILKLTEEDYNAAGLQELLATADGAAYELNLKGFYRLQNAITGWPGGRTDGSRPKPLRGGAASVFPKRILIFSPRPEDDVLSMGGTLARLAAQGHEVHIAYQTSGASSLPVEILERFRLFARDSGATLGEGPEALRHQYSLIRQLDAKAAAKICGIPPERLYFLDLSFDWHVGEVVKRSVTGKDVETIAELLTRVAPHQIYAASDRNDPEGTSRLGLESLRRALQATASLPWASDCDIWLYRGGGSAWPLPAIEMAVPLSPSEVLRKRRAITQHETLRQSATLPGSTPHQLHELSSRHDRATAEAFDRLGLAEYESMETFTHPDFVSNLLVK